MTFQIDCGALAGRLRALIDERRMTQRDLASVASLSESAVSQYLSGAREPSLRVFCALCDALKVSPMVLLGSKKPCEAGEGDAERSAVREAAAVVTGGAHLLASDERLALVNALFAAEGEERERAEVRVACR